EEIDWETITKESGSLTPLLEKTSVTNKVRRVARFTPDVVRQAIEVNQPSLICLNHLDYVDVRCGRGEFTYETTRFVSWIEHAIGQRIDYLGFGPQQLVSRQAAA